MNAETIESSSVKGFVAEGFEGVQTAFAGAAALPGGAAFAAYQDGEVIADLWLGDAAPGRPWERDTPAVIMSATKGVIALAAHICVDRGLLDLDAPVAAYWPEFAANGKEKVLVRHVLSHTSGVITVPGYETFMRSDGTGWDRQDEITGRIATATPIFEPGTKATYHALTFGWMIDELIRRVTGKDVQQVINDDINGPLGIEISLGAAARSQLGARRAHVVNPPRATEDDPDLYAFQQAYVRPDNPIGQSLLGNGTTNVVLDMERFMNEGPGVTYPLTSSNGITTARDLARLFQALALGGELDGVRIISQAAIETAAALEFEGVNEFWGSPARWALGFFRSGNMDGLDHGKGSGFGHPGQGGQNAWADPERGLSFAYTRSYLGLVPDQAPMEALYAALD